MPDHDHFMGLAIEEARKAFASMETPVGAVLAGPGGEILATGRNAPIALCDPTAHAEIVALRAASRELQNYRLPGTVLYVTLEPCIMCVGAMVHARVDHLVFGARDPKTGAAGSIVDLTNAPFLNHHMRVTGGVRADECGELLQRFFRERRLSKKEPKGGEVPKWP